MEKSLPRNYAMNGRSLPRHHRRERRRSPGTSSDYHHTSSDNDCDVNPYEAIDHRNDSDHKHPSRKHNDSKNSRRRYEKNREGSRGRIYSTLSGSSGGDIETDSKESPGTIVRDQQQQRLLNSNRNSDTYENQQRQLHNQQPYYSKLPHANHYQHQHHHKSVTGPSSRSTTPSESSEYSDATVTDSELVLTTGTNGRYPKRAGENTSGRKLTNSCRSVNTMSMGTNRKHSKPGNQNDCNHQDSNRYNSNNDHQSPGDFEPSCLVRTPSGSLFIPSDYPVNNETGSHIGYSSPTQNMNDQKNYNCDRYQLGFSGALPVPVMPVRGDLRQQGNYNFSASRFKLGKTISTRCSWKCVAIVFIFLFLALLPVLCYFIAIHVGHMNQSVKIAPSCTSSGRAVKDMKYMGHPENSLNPNIDANSNSTYDIRVEHTSMHVSSKHVSHSLKHENKLQISSLQTEENDTADLLKMDQVFGTDIEGISTQDQLEGSGDMTVVAIDEEEVKSKGTDVMMHDQIRIEAKGSPVDNKIDLVSSMGDETDKLHISSTNMNQTSDITAESNLVDSPNTIKESAQNLDESSLGNNVTSASTEYIPTTTSITETEIENSEFTEELVAKETTDATLEITPSEKSPDGFTTDVHNITKSTITSSPGGNNSTNEVIRAIAETVETSTSEPTSIEMKNSTDSSDNGSNITTTVSSTLLSESNDTLSMYNSTEPTFTGIPSFTPRTAPPGTRAFQESIFGAKLTSKIPVYSHWNLRFRQSEPSVIRFNFTIPVDTSFGVYGKRGGSPSHTRYDFAHILPSSNNPSRLKRYAKDTVDSSFTEFLDAGFWYISVYNDDDQANEIVLMSSSEGNKVFVCPSDCRDHGNCMKGVCHCFPGYTGYDCSEQTCPELCSGHGEYVAGECHCLSGWKGKECSVRRDECEIEDCNRQGECINGNCVCMQGYKGQHCEQIDCMFPECSNHGVCVRGECICKKGWKGDDCSQVDNNALRCLPDCSGRGNYDLDLQQCICNSQWTGKDCSLERCDMDCGSHGQCDGSRCKCDSGWTGYKCQDKTCDTRCNEHGQCRNGTCLCIQGWNGKHCTLEGCPNSCNGHGECVRNGEEYRCRCNSDYDGKDCSIPVEMDCNDDIDNDKDGLTDCADSECCSSDRCSDSQMCITSLDPLDILLRKQPPAVTASFFQKMRFLIEEESVQSYAGKKAFNDSRASVIRGQVISESGSGLVGIRVSAANDPKYGFTLTRDTGWFDLMVNGGGAVTLLFSRSPFKPRQQTVNVPWNEIIIIDQVVMAVDDDIIQSNRHTSTCSDHDYDRMKPVVLATWKHGFQGGCPSENGILAESQVVQESLHITGSDLYLVYHSSRVAGYLSTIQLQLTPKKIPESLRLVHLRIAIEGILFEKTFEADPNIKFTYSWNRRNVYRQRVYGIATAKVHVGYEYNACRHIIWEVRTTTLSGHDMSISEIGGWNLNIHHRYNFHEGILQKGDGSNIYLKHRPMLLLTTMGNGEQRPLECYDCDGIAAKQKLLAPVALTSGPDGSVYVGDFNVIRRINSEGSVKTIVELGISQVPYRYHLAVSPMDGKLYISDPERHQIFKVISTDNFDDPKKNIEAVVGNGHKCVPGDKAQCGDGFIARDARLSYPKGIAVSADNILYIADGTNIRMVDDRGKISTLIGDHRHKNHWKPIPCNGTINANEVNLRWPTELAVNPLDGSLHVVDDHMILRVTQDLRLKVIAGRPLHCPFPADSSDNPASLHSSGKPITLESPQSIAFSTDGRLYIAESDSQTINRIRVISSEGIITRFAGSDSKCSCLIDTCKCFDNQSFLASTAKFNTISSITVTPDGQVHISDQGNLRIRSVLSSLPEPNSYREYKVYSPETQEIYFFNRFGQHISTQSILMGKTIYTFTYTVNTSFGKLSTVTDAAGNKIYVLRDYSNQVNTIENTIGQKCGLKMSRMGMLQEYITPENFRYYYQYHGSTGLIQSKTDSSSNTYIYDYDSFGRLTSVTGPSGRIIELVSDLSQEGASVSIYLDGVRSAMMSIDGADVTVHEKDAEKRTIVHSDGSVNLFSPWSTSSELETVPNSLLAEQDQMMGETFPVPAKLKTSINGITIQRVEWRYYLRREGKANKKIITQVGRKLRVNGVNLLNIEYDRTNFVESVSDSNNIPLLTIHYDSLGRPSKWVPNENLNLTGVSLRYDRYGRLSKWTRGTISETYGYDRNARLSQITYSDGTIVKYVFKDSVSILPSSVMLPSDATYRISYDKHGSMNSIKTPVGHVHSFYIQPSLGFNRFVYYMPGIRYPYVMHIDDTGKVMAKILPNDHGRILYNYNDYGKLVSEICGQYKIEYMHYEKSGLLKTAMHTNVNNFVSRTDFKYHSGIVKEIRHRFSSRSGLSNAKFKYQYESGAELASIAGEIGGKEIPQIVFQKNPETKMPEKISQFGILYPKANSVFIQDDGRQYSQTRLTDSYNKLMLCAITIQGKVVFTYDVKYNIRGRIQQVKVKQGRDSGTYETDFLYTIDGYLSKVEGKNWWIFTHDTSGTLVSMSQNGQSVRLRHDDGGRMIRYDDTELNVVDERGFVVKRNNEKFTYNSKGQLISVTHNHHYGFSYQYDVIGRLVARKDHRGNITQFYYANPNNLELLTHVHYPGSGRTFSLIYDDLNFLMYMQQSSTKYFVANDHLGSPIAIFNEEGDVIKKITRSPFGNTLSDTNQELYVPIDFMGGIRDPVTGIIHFGSKTYDPLSMQWMTPQWQHVEDLMKTPQNLHLYRFMRNDPINAQDYKHHHKYFTELEEWMPLLGYRTNLMLNPLVQNGMVSFEPKSYDKVLMADSATVMPGLSCIANDIRSNFLRLSTIPKPAVKRESFGKNFSPFVKRVAALSSFIGHGIVVSRVGNKAVVKATQNADQIFKDVIISVLNNTYFLSIHFSSNTQESFYLCKDSAGRANEDMHQLQRLGSTLNVTKNAPDDGNNKQVELHIRSEYMNLNIRYGTTYDEEFGRVARLAKRRAIQRAWSQEKELVRLGKQGRRHWTKSEAEQLLRRGTVKGYTEMTVHSIEDFPALGDDSTNIMIQKVSSSMRTARPKTR